MNIDPANLTLQQILITLLGLAALDLITGLGTAIAKKVVLYTYMAQWLVANLLPALVAWALAIAGKGVPAIGLTADPLIWVVFLAAWATYVAAQLASIASNLGIDLTKLPFAGGLAGGAPPPVMEWIKTDTGGQPVSPAVPPGPPVVPPGP